MRKYYNTSITIDSIIWIFLFISFLLELYLLFSSVETTTKKIFIFLALLQIIFIMIFFKYLGNDPLIKVFIIFYFIYFIQRILLISFDYDNFDYFKTVDIEPNIIDSILFSLFSCMGILSGLLLGRKLSRENVLSHTFIHSLDKKYGGLNKQKFLYKFLFFSGMELVS